MGRTWCILCAALLFAFASPSSCLRKATRASKVAHPEKDNVPDGAEGGIASQALDDLEEEMEEEEQQINEEEERKDKLDHFKAGLSTLQELVGQLARQAVIAAEGKMPDVVRTVSEYAHSVHDIASGFGEKIAAELNMCDAQKRQQVQRAAAGAIASYRAAVRQLADTAVDNWPAVKDNSEAFINQSFLKVVAVRKALKKATMDSPQLTEATYKLRVAFNRLRDQLASRTPPVMEAFLSKLQNFSDEAADFAKKVAEFGVATYDRHEIQAALAAVQETAGQLASMAMEKWPHVKEAFLKTLSKFATIMEAKVRQYGEELLDKVNVCKPEVRQKMKDAMSHLQERVLTLKDAVVKRLPTVKESLVSFAEAITEKAQTLHENIIALASSHVEKEQMREAFRKIRAYVEKLRIQVVNKTSSHLQDNEQLKSCWQGVSKAVGTVFLRLRGLEGSADLEEDEVDAAGESCFLKDVKFEPNTMKGTSRVTLASTAACQELCVKTEGCAFFSYWANGGCHLQAEGASMRRAVGVIAGPKTCPPAQNEEDGDELAASNSPRAAAATHASTSTAADAQSAAENAESATQDLDDVFRRIGGFEF